MKTRHVLACFLAAGLLLGASPVPAAALTVGHDWDLDQSAQTERFSKTVPVSKTGSVFLSNVAGDIVVTGGTGDQVVIEAVKRAKTAEALKRAQIEVIATADRVEILTKYAESDGHREGPSVSYTLTVPRGVALRVKSVSGDLTVSTIDGELRADTVSGDVRLTQTAKVDGAKSVSGDVIVKGGGAVDTIDVESVSGDVELSAFKARAIDASSVSGNVELSDVTTDQVTAKSVSGDITFAGPLAKSGRYAMSSHSGDVVVRIQNNAGFEVSASSFSGDIRSDFELTVRFGGDEGGRHGRRQEIRGTYGDGSARLDLKAFSGSVRITGKDTAAPAKK